MALIKICGVKTLEAGLAAAEAGADLIGLVFVPKSPRHIRPGDAVDLITDIKQGCYDASLTPPRFVGLFVDAGEQLLAEVAPFLSYFQLHGHEDPDRVSELGDEFGMEIIKALPVGGAEDVARAHAFASVADMILFDARPPKGADLTGGNGVAFDWSHLSAYKGEAPFLVAGGLTAENVGDAVAAARRSPGFAGVDVSSGVESAPGRKDAAAIRTFTAVARQALG